MSCVVTHIIYCKECLMTIHSRLLDNESDRSIHVTVTYLPLYYYRDVFDNHIYISSHVI
jgi:hypothetical protein